MKVLANLKREIYIKIGGPPRFDLLNKYISNKAINILDVGCGLISPQTTKNTFPLCKYYGIDKIHLDDVSKIERYWSIDLDKSNLDEIPNDKFDVIIFSHVIEHLINGKKLIINLISKLKTKGLFYIEFPSKHTAVLPSLKKINVTFNFFDDTTHKRLYTREAFLKLLKSNGFIIKQDNVYFNWKKIPLFPLLMGIRFIKEK